MAERPPEPRQPPGRIIKEAQCLRVERSRFAIRATLSRSRPGCGTWRRRRRPKKPSKNAERRGGTGGGTGTSGRARRLPRPAASSRPRRGTRTYDEGGIFRVSVPSNWRELQDSDAVTFAPDGGYGTLNGQNVFTHGIQIGLGAQRIARPADGDRRADRRVRARQPGHGSASGYERISIDGRPGLRTTLTNVNEATRQRETIQLATAETRNGDLLYSRRRAARRVQYLSRRVQSRGGNDSANALVVCPG